MIKINNIKANYFLLIFLAAVSLRSVNLTQPLLEGAATRQVENAMIARNFYQDKLDIFYPYLNDFGKDPAYQMIEFQLIPFLGAIIYRLLGGVYEPVLRCIIIFFFGLSTVFLYKLLKYYFDRTLALCAVFVFSFSPISIYLGRAFHYEMPMLFFILASLYYFSLWMDRKKRIYLFISALCCSVALLLKVINFYVIFILLFLAAEKFRGKIFKKLDLYIFAGIVFLFVVPWYMHARSVMVRYPNMYSFYYNDTFGFMWKMMKFWLSNPLFYKINFDNLVTYTLTPLGFGLAIAGFFMKSENRNDRLIYAWLLSACILFIAAPAEATQGYYQIHFLVPCSLLIGKALTKLIKLNFFGKTTFDRKLFICALLLIVFVVVTRYSIGLYRVPESLGNVVKTGKVVQSLTKNEDLLIASAGNSAELLYYSNRSGWPFMIDLEAKRQQDKTDGTDVSRKIYDPIEVLERLRKEGAGYFVSASKENEFLKNKIFSEYMFANYKLIRETPDYIIFDLRGKEKR
ncbi:MAG: glycosyltransferase family 39 protein [Candidatus Omnitrophota bacterium]|nr:glycosyltransferase family 39 protein [Candidatus Omnitrophota bacterium]